MNTKNLIVVAILIGIFVNISFVFGEDSVNISPEWKYKCSPNSVAITSDGKYIVAGGNYPDGCIYLFNNNGKILWKYNKTDGVFYVCITPDGKYIAAGGQECRNDRYHKYDNYVYLFNISGDLLWKCKVDGYYVKSMSLTPDGRYIVVGIGNYIYLFDKSGKLLWRYGAWEVRDFYSVAITPDGKYIVAGSCDDNIYLFSTNGDLLWKPIIFTCNGCRYVYIKIWA